jgi:Regulator of chromosome condensation (RCC1) repeat
VVLGALERDQLLHGALKRQGHQQATAAPQLRDPCWRILGLPPIVAIAAGYYHSLALARDGIVWTCGRDDSGSGSPRVILPRGGLQRQPRAV